MAAVVLPRSLAALFPGSPRRLDVEAGSVTELVRALDERWPGMWDRLCEPGPRIREHVNVFVDGERVALDAPLGPGSIVHIIPAVAGGALARLSQPASVRPAQGRGSHIAVMPGAGSR